MAAENEENRLEMRAATGVAVVIGTGAAALGLMAIAAPFLLVPAVTKFGRIPWMATPMSIIQQTMHQLMLSRTIKGVDIVCNNSSIRNINGSLNSLSRPWLIDLGSGDGRMVIEAAKNGFNAVGIELNPVLVLLSYAKAARAGVLGRVSFRMVDFWRVPLQPYDVITCFGVAPVMARLDEKLKKEGKVIESSAKSLMAHSLDHSCMTMTVKQLRELLHYKGALETGDKAVLIARWKEISTDPTRKPTLRETRKRGKGLSMAVAQGNIEQIFRYLATGTPIDELLSSGISPLYRAVTCDQVEVVAYLLERGASANHASILYKWWTPLHKACQRYNGIVCSRAKQMRIIELLIQHDASTTALDVENKTPEYYLGEEHASLMHRLKQRHESNKSRWSFLLFAHGTGLVHNPARMAYNPVDAVDNPAQGALVPKQCTKDYPQSRPAVTSTQKCLQNSDLRRTLMMFI